MPPRVVPSDGSDPDVLRPSVLAGRYAKVRMLYHLGKDVVRSIDQCQDLVERTPVLDGRSAGTELRRTA